MTYELSALIDRFNRIYEPLTVLNEQVADAIVDNPNHPLWVYGDVDRKALGSFICDLEYLDDDAAGGSTTYLPAVVGLPAENCAMMVTINDLRTQLVELLKEADGNSSSEGIQLSKYILDKVHLRRLNRKATLRQFIVLQDTPQSISFMWSKPTVNKRLTKQQAENVVAWHINKHDDSDIREKLLYEQKLIALLPDDEVVAKVYMAPIHPRVNIIINNKRMPVKAALMPLFYPANANDPLPDISPLPAIKVLKKRLKRSDTLLEQEPYAPIVKIHRYKR